MSQTLAAQAKRAPCLPIAPSLSSSLSSTLSSTPTSHHTTPHHVGDDLELYVRWVQSGSYSAVLRNHDRGGSAGSCADDGAANPNTDNANGCWVDMPWLTPTAEFEAMKVR